MERAVNTTNIRIRQGYFVFLAFFFVTVKAHGGPTKTESLALTKIELSEFSSYAPGEVRPFGARNPDAPSEISQYEFMIGEWSCDERYRQPDGGWKTHPSLVRGVYFLNGYGILNQTYLAQEASLMTYQFNQESGTWWIINSRAPGFSSTEWVGKKEGDSMVARRDGKTSPNGPERSLKITFHNIKMDSFQWKLEVINVSGPFSVREKTCSRLN